MQNKETNYDDLIKKINSLEASLRNLKNQLNSVYTICNTQMSADRDDDIKDTKNE
mgnify:CR=1 FL=1|tara:strand:+ start:166 stop:330 length:165 start_codon:yes stop_codon:yes gene_type:complete